MRKLLTALLLLAVTACQPNTAPVNVQPFTYDGPSYRFNASRVDVVDDYAPTPQPKRERSPDNSLGEAMHKWSNSKLTAGSAQNILEVHITTAQIVKKELPKQKTGIEGFFTSEPTEDYEGKLTVELRLYTPERTLPMAKATISAERSHALNENATLEDRKAVYRQITAEIMREMDRALDRNIHNYFSQYLL